MEDILCEHSSSVPIIPFKEEFDKRAGGGVRINVEDGVFRYPQLEGVLQEAAGVMVLQTGGVRVPAGHESEDHGLVASLEDPVTDDQRLETEVVKIQTEGVQLGPVCKLTRISELFFTCINFKT